MNVCWLDTVDSTNSEALRRLPELPSGTVLAAYEQTAGRGQRGNTWFTQSGKNLTFSIVLKYGPGGLPALSAADAIRLNALSSVAVARFLQAHGVRPFIKWPNDIYVNGGKICGMLIENSLDGSGIGSSVLGIGINLNQRVFPQLANATSLALCTGEEYPLEAALDEFLAIFEDLLPLLPEEDLFREYSSRLFRKGESARYHDLLTDREYRGVIQGVAPDGRLCIRDLDAPSSPLHHYRFKEVSYLL